MNNQNNIFHIQTLLVHEGFVKQEDIHKAEEIRAENMKLARLPLGQILLTESDLTGDDIMEILDTPECHGLLASILKEKRWFNTETMKTSRTVNGVNILSGLFTKGVITELQYGEVMEDLTGRIAFGKLAVQLKKITGEDLGNVVQIKKYSKSVSEILYDLKLVTLTELNHVFRKVYKGLKIGNILIQQGLITEEKLNQALSEQRGSSLSLGKIFIKNQYLTLEQLYFALSIQYNTPFQPLPGFLFNEKLEIELRNIVGQRYAEENGILPLFINDNNLTLGVSNPSNIMRMHELMPVHPHLKMNCVLITEEKFEQLYAILYGEIINSSLLSDVFDVEEVPPDRKFVLTSPETQFWLLGNLYERYLKLGGSLLNEDQNEVSDLFSEFIIESYNYISEEFNCKSVSFWFEIKNGNIDIMAQPNR